MQKSSDLCGKTHSNIQSKLPKQFYFIYGLKKKVNSPKKSPSNNQISY